MDRIREKLRQLLLRKFSFSRLLRSALLIYLCLTAHAYAFADSIIFQPPPPTQPYTYHEVKSWHKKLGDKYWASVPRVIPVDLNGDGLEERFLLVQGFSGGGVYALFLYHDSMWHPIANKVRLSHLPLRVLETSHGGWKDFLTFVPSENGSQVVETRYILSGTGYIQASSRTLDLDEVRVND